MLLPIGIAAFIVVCIIIAICDVFWPFSLLVLALLAGAWWFEHWHLIVPVLQPIYIIPYLLIGLAWIFFKWTRVVEKHIKKYRERNGNNHDDKLTAPDWKDHSYDFAAYYFYWPLDLIAYFLSDFLLEAWEYVSNMVAGTFNRYAEWRINKIKAGLK